MRLNLPLYSYKLRSGPASPARLVNCFPELLPAGARTPVALKRAPGIKAWATPGNGGIRGLIASPFTLADDSRLDKLWAVSGGELYQVNADATDSSIGTLPTSGRVDMVTNVDSLIVITEPRGFRYDGLTLAEIVDDDFVSRGAGDVELLDDFLLFREPDSPRFFGADIGSGVDFDALQFAIADDSPDDLNGMLADKGILLNFGLLTLELWENTGVAGFPFERIINGTVEVGCYDAKTVGRVFNQVFWVADDLTVRRLEGLAPIRVSNHAIEQHLATETVLEAFTYAQEGHFFYCLSTSGGTYTYDVVTGEWHERESYGEANWLPRHHAFWQKKVLVADHDSNRIGEMDVDTFTDWGSTQRMEWTYQPIYADGQRAFHKRFEIVLETGVGATTGQGSDPKIMLQKSDDGGETWQSLPDKTFGKKGERLSRAVWHNLGSSRQRVYRAAVSDPVPVTVTDTIIEVDGGRL